MLLKICTDFLCIEISKKCLPFVGGTQYNKVASLPAIIHEIHRLLLQATDLTQHPTVVKSAPRE